MGGASDVGFKGSYRSSDPVEARLSVKPSTYSLARR